jgi:hypothetical protein
MRCNKIYLIFMIMNCMITHWSDNCTINHMSSNNKEIINDIFICVNEKFPQKLAGAYDGCTKQQQLMRLVSFKFSDYNLLIHTINYALLIIFLSSYLISIFTLFWRWKQLENSHFYGLKLKVSRTNHSCFAWL